MTHADERELLRQIATDNGFALAIDPHRWENASYIQREHILQNARETIDEFGFTGYVVVL